MSVLFEETAIKSMALKNRLVRSATHEGLADKNGVPTERLFNLYEKLARGGVGLIITGYAYVSRDGNSYFPGMSAIDRDELIPEYRRMVERVHDQGAKIAMQISHCGRQSTREAAGGQPLGPSAVMERAFMVTPREMTEADIERIIKAFGHAARRVRESGFDAVQVHASHGYLLSSFLSPHSNRRKDQWGGSIENRMRIVKRVYEECRKAVGDDYPVLIKFNAYDKMKKGLKLEEGVVMAEMMADMGFDGLEVSCGTSEDGNSLVRGELHIDVILDEWDIYKKKNALFRFFMRKFGEKIMPPVPFSEGYNLEAARTVKSRVNIPVMAVGGLVRPEQMEAVVENGEADYISLSRPLIADPNFPKKIVEGSREPSRCIHCNLCVFYMPAKSLRCYYGKKLKKPDA